MKRILLFTALLISSLCYSQAKVSGVITYYFNKYQGNKPDIGAKLIFIDSSKVKSFDYNVYNNYHYGTSYRNLNLSLESNNETLRRLLETYKGKKRYASQIADLNSKIDYNQKLIESNLKQLLQFDSETEEKYNANQSKLFNYILRFDDNLPSKSVDGNGNYSINIPSGAYYVFIRSKGRNTKYSLIEDDGNIYVKKITVKDKEEKDLSYNFELN